MGNQSMEKLPTLLTVKEAAQIARKGNNFVYWGVRDGLIPSIRLGKTIRIPRDKYLAYLNGDLIQA